MCSNGAAHTQVEKERDDGAAQRKRGGVCGNRAAHTQTQVGKEHGDGAARRKGGECVQQRGRTHSGRDGTRPRGRAEKRMGEEGGNGVTHIQVRKERGHGAAQSKGRECPATEPRKLRLLWGRYAATGLRKNKGGRRAETGTYTLRSGRNAATGPQKEKAGVGGGVGGATGPHTLRSRRNATTEPRKKKGGSVCSNGAAHTQVGKGCAYRAA